VTINRAELPAMRTARDFQHQAGDPKAAGKLAKWMLRLGRLRQYDLAMKLAREELEEDAQGAEDSNRGMGGGRGDDREVGHSN
jgi:hypothetical protein